MQARQSQQHYPRQASGNMAMQPAPLRQQRYTTSYVMSNHGSVVSSVAPSARNSPPMQPMQPRVSVPGFMPQESSRHYVPVDNAYARNSWPTQVQPQVRRDSPPNKTRRERERGMIRDETCEHHSCVSQDSFVWEILVEM